MTAVTAASGYDPPNRFITTHDKDGTSVFSTAIPSTLEVQKISPTLEFYLPYVTSTFPVDMGADADTTTYRSFLEGAKPGLVNKGGSILRVTDFAPSSTTAMHRTLSLDYGIVIAGEIECLLDSGESRLMKVGDMTMQRGTNHAWRVPGNERWARMIFILQEAKPLEIGGVTLKEEYGDLKNIAPSNT